MSEYYYRYEDQSYAIADEYGDYSYSELIVHLRKYKVVKHTPKGVRVVGGPYGGKGRFVNNSHKKRLAYPTIEEAKESFIKRKNRQISIYQHRIERAENALEKLKDNWVSIGADW